MTCSDKQAQINILQNVILQDSVQLTNLQRTGASSTIINVMKSNIDMLKVQSERLKTEACTYKATTINYK